MVIFKDIINKIHQRKLIIDIRQSSPDEILLSKILPYIWPRDMYSRALVGYKHPLNISTLKNFLDELKNSNYIKTEISNKNMLYAAFINNNSLHLDVIDMKELISLYKQHQNIDSFNTIPTTELFPIY